MTIETRPVVPVEPKEKSVADVLRHAALIIEERGWVRFAGAKGHEDGTGRVCLVGSIEAAGSNEIAYDMWFIRQIGALPMSWNDAPGRTAAEVIAALRAAADAAERGTV